MAGRYTDDGDPDPGGGGKHKFTGSICQTDPTTPNPDRQPTFHAMCKDGYQESPDSTHHYYVCDHTGHWVVGTKGCADCEGDGCKGCNDANPYLPPEGPGGQELKCLGQMCRLIASVFGSASAQNSAIVTSTSRDTIINPQP
eukprot:COSAG01_NODE_16467_length_1234_cov_10.948018_1_plen_141_part_10